MHRLLLVAALFIAVAPAAAQAPSDPWQHQKLWYTAPAPDWDNSLPVGNGRLGATVLGGLAEERIVLNEETLWSGGPYDPTNPGGYKALPEIQRLIFEGDIEKAHDLFGRTMMGIPYEQMKYQPFADLRLTFAGHEAGSDYRRELDMDRAMVTVRYKVGDVTYTRETFSTAVDQVVAMRISADRPGAINFDAVLLGFRNQAHSNYGTDYFWMDGLGPDTLRVTGKSSTFLGIEGRMRYEGRLVARPEGGTVEVDYKTLKVRNADAVVLLFAAATNFVRYDDISADPAARVAAYLDKVKDRSWDAMLADHLEEHRSWFRRVSLVMGPDTATVPTDVQLKRYAAKPDPHLAGLAYQFGRYLLIGSSRPGTNAANLQGIWNDNSNPWWDSKYTININIPMNYWPAETGGLPELSEPLFSLIKDVSETGRSVAREHWGARGWVLHQNTDQWRAAAPMDGASWGSWPVGGAWLSTHLWERYLFDPDEDFLRAWYPVLRDQARFLADILVENPKTGYLVIAPGMSPENFPLYPGNGRFFDEVTGSYLKGRMMQAGVTMDNQIVRDLFDAYLNAAEVLGVDPEMRAEVAEKGRRLPPNQVGRHGQLQEWFDDWEDLEPEHRHISHLYGLWPGDEITPRGTPVEAAAASVTLDLRKTGGCGWSYGWKVGLRARLAQPEQAHEQIARYLSDNVLTNMFSRCGRALQVDGSFGTTAGIAEMLIQSHTDTLDVLPALPAAWPNGRVEGLRARGGLTVDLAWEIGRATELVVRTTRAGTLILRGAPTGQVTVDGGRARSRAVAPGVISVEARAGATYRFVSSVR